MDDIAIGRLAGFLRRRLGLRQEDVARRAKVSQQLVSVFETGGVGRISMGAARGIASAIGAELVITVRWRGAEMDRVRDEGHAAVVADGPPVGVRSSRRQPSGGDQHQRRW